MPRLFTLLLCLVVAGPVAAADPATLTLTGRGEVSRAADMATIRLGATATRPTARAALDETSRKVAAILDALTAAGVAEGDVQTTRLSLRAVRRDQGTGSPPEIVAFSAGNMLTVRLRDLDRLGAVLAEVAEAGGNSFRGLSFSLADPSAAEAAARRAAVGNAMDRAHAYVRAAGVALGPIRSIKESGGRRPRPMAMAEAAMARDAAPVPVSGGTLRFTAEVHMVFELEQ